MITKINAELDSVETAELAARMIKQRTGGIINIKIDSKSKERTHNDYDNTTLVAPYFMQSGVLNYQQPNSNYVGGYAGGFINLDEHQDYDSREISRAVVIDVICENEAANTVTQVFTSLGGLKINKN